MAQIHIKRFGFACGITAVILYLGCILLMFIAGREGTVKFFNSMLHGIEVSSIIRMNVPVVDALMGIVQIFVLGWLTGACIAAFYNVTIKRS